MNVEVVTITSGPNGEFNRAQLVQWTQHLSSESRKPGRTKITYLQSSSQSVMRDLGSGQVVPCFVTQLTAIVERLEMGA